MNIEAPGERPPPISSRQACSLLLLMATLIGSCVALAVRTLLESGSGMLLMVLVLGFLASMISVFMTISRRYLRQRREQAEDGDEHDENRVLLLVN